MKDGKNSNNGKQGMRYFIKHQENGPTLISLIPKDEAEQNACERSLILTEQEFKKFLFYQLYELRSLCAHIDDERRFTAHIGTFKDDKFFINEKELEMQEHVYQSLTKATAYAEEE